MAGMPTIEPPPLHTIPSPEFIESLQLQLHEAKEAFRAYMATEGGQTDARFNMQKCLALSNAISSARNAFAETLRSIFEAHSLLVGKTLNDTGFRTLTRSTQEAGCFQLTRLDHEGTPIGHSDYRRLDEAVLDFLREIEPRSVVLPQAGQELHEDASRAMHESSLREANHSRPSRTGSRP